MRTIILSAILALSLAACEGTGDRTYNAPDLDSGSGAGSSSGIGTDNAKGNPSDTTPTTNNNLYHTDSAAGQGSVYDSSNLNNKNNTNNPAESTPTGSNQGGGSGQSGSNNQGNKNSQ